MTLLHIEQYGNVFEVRLTTDATLNAWRGKMILPTDVIVREVAYGESIGDIWQTPPTAAGREIDFAGGRTVGFTGDGLLFRFYAAAGPNMSVTNPELIRFDTTQTKIYAADGRGTEVIATLQPLTVNSKELLAASTSSIAGDTASPQPFMVTLVHDTALFDGKATILFSTTDADSGIGHYEIEERTSHGTIGWHRAESPYLVGPDVNVISVKAVDRAGNFRVEKMMFPQTWPSALEIWLFAGLLLLVILTAVYLIRRFKKHR